ncbi:hypothetical protein THOM_1293 [Trachipleistophora hominis]|uniref:Uncharacterized protein n=1 Tax=Trachipleistophora hominis TaxID=72359 RepID=L7JWU0_TRAHO|nr:hypothetical protein THOM_1293 [Trachipleistophora hominis]
MATKGEDDNEITRYILYGYIGIHIRKINITERQKSAFAKMSFLTPLQFECLIKDVKTEINRRITKREPADNDNIRLSNLSELKFRDLVIDLFLVFNKKFPSKRYDNTDETEVMIYNLENLIHSLKNENEGVMKNLRMISSVFKRIRLYQKYLKSEFTKQNKNTQIIDYMDTVFDSHDCLLLEILNNPDYMTNIADRKLKNNCYYENIRTKYKYEQNLSEKNGQKDYVLKVIELLLFNKSYDQETDEALYLLKNYEKIDKDHDNRLELLILRLYDQAQRLGFSEKAEKLKNMKVPVEKKERGDMVCFLAEVLRNIIIKDRNIGNIR